MIKDTTTIWSPVASLLKVPTIFVGTGRTNIQDEREHEANRKRQEKEKRKERKVTVRVLRRLVLWTDGWILSHLLGATQYPVLMEVAINHIEREPLASNSYQYILFIDHKQQSTEWYYPDVFLSIGMIGNDDARYGVPRRRGAQRADSPVVTVGTTNSSTRWQNKMIVDETPHTEGMTTNEEAKQTTTQTTNTTTTATHHDTARNRTWLSSSKIPQHPVIFPSMLPHEKIHGIICPLWCVMLVVLDWRM